MTKRRHEWKIGAWCKDATCIYCGLVAHVELDYGRRMLRGLRTKIWAFNKKMQKVAPSQVPCDPEE